MNPLYKKYYEDATQTRESIEQEVRSLLEQHGELLGRYNQAIEAQSGLAEMIGLAAPSASLLSSLNPLLGAGQPDIAKEAESEEPFDPDSEEMTPSVRAAMDSDIAMRDRADLELFRGIEELGPDGQRLALYERIIGKGIEVTQPSVEHRIRRYIKAGVLERVESPRGRRYNHYRIVTTDELESEPEPKPKADELDFDRSPNGNGWMASHLGAE